MEWAIVVFTARAISRIVQTYRAIRWRVRLLWRAAYGVPWEWIARGEWRNPDLFYGRKPWHCILCGKPWLPGEDWIPVYGEIRERPEGNRGPGRPYDDAVSWPSEWGREVGWYVRSLHLWKPTGWLDGHVRYLCRRPHPRRTIRGMPIPMQVTDCLTGERIDLRTGPMALNTMEYAGRWAWVHVRAILVFAFLIFRVLWAWAWSLCPVRAFRVAAYVLDGPADRMLGGNRWGFSSVATLLGRPTWHRVRVEAAIDWRRFEGQCGRLVERLVHPRRS